MTKSKDLMSEIVSGQTYRLYNNIGTHLLCNSCKKTSLEAILLTFPSASEMTYIVSSGALNSTHSLTLTFPKIAFAER